MYGVLLRFYGALPPPRYLPENARIVRQIALQFSS